MRLLSDNKLNEIRGKAIVGMATVAEIMSVFEHLDSIYNQLDLSDSDDTFGTEGWQVFFGLPD